MNRIYTLFFILLLVSCTTTPKIEEMQKAIANYELPNNAKKGEASIYVVRPDPMGSLVRFNIHVGEDELDENEIGWTRGYQRLNFYLPAGKHRILSVAENTAEMDIEVKAGDKVFIRQNPHFGIIFARNSIHKIEETEGTYWYMKMGEGVYVRTRIENLERKMASINNRQN